MWMFDQERVLDLKVGCFLLEGSLVNLSLDILN